MKLIFINDDDEVIENWYVADEEYTPREVRAIIESAIATYDNREQFEAFASAAK